MTFKITIVIIQIPSVNILLTVVNLEIASLKFTNCEHEFTIVNIQIIYVNVKVISGISILTCLYL